MHRRDGLGSDLGEESADELEERRRHGLVELTLDAHALGCVLPEAPGLALGPRRKLEPTSGHELVARREHAHGDVAARALLEERARARAGEERACSDRL